MSRGRLVVHGHFYQPSRVDPFTGRHPEEPTAAPFRDWNSRIDAECYRPIAERGTYAHLSWDLGPTLASWLAAYSPVSHAGFVAGDRGVTGMATGYHHAILPLASAADRRTEIRWGLRDFQLRFGRRALGFWLPETAVDLPTLRALADEGVRYTILAPWQAADPGLDTRRPYRIDLGDGRDLRVAFYDAGLSAALSFDPSATADADQFARDRVVGRLAGAEASDGTPGLVVIATDGELYGHHQPFRDLFLDRLVSPAGAVPDRGFDVVDLAAAVLEPDAAALPLVEIVERTSWSCHHGVARWSGECPCTSDPRWKQPLRAALDRLAGGIDALTDRRMADVPGAPSRVALRDAWIDVLAGAASAEQVVRRAAPAAGDELPMLAALVEAQRWRLAMFASDGWFWDDPFRIETRQVLRCAARAARLVDGVCGSRLERALVEDLRLLRSPAEGLDGAAIYELALADLGQPPPPAA